MVAGSEVDVHAPSEEGSRRFDLEVPGAVEETLWVSPSGWRRGGNLRYAGVGRDETAGHGGSGTGTMEVESSRWMSGRCNLEEEGVKKATTKIF